LRCQWPIGSTHSRERRQVPLEVAFERSSGEVRPPYNNAPPGPQKSKYVHWLPPPTFFFSCRPLASHRQRAGCSWVHGPWCMSLYRTSNKQRCQRFAAAIN
jgi:hypothetical protein